MTILYEENTQYDLFISGLVFEKNEFGNKLNLTNSGLDGTR